MEPTEQSSPSLELDTSALEEPIFSYLNTELPQHTTHPSSWGEILGWGWHGDMETAGTTAAQEAHTGAGSRLIQKLYPREQLSHHSCCYLCLLQSCMGLNKTWVETACPQIDGAFGLVAPVDVGFGLPWCVFLAAAACKPIPKNHPAGPDWFFHFSFAVVPPQISNYMAISRERSPCTLLFTQADTLKMH